MADMSQKKGAYIRRYVAAIENLLDAANVLADLKTEWDANAYATGASPVGNNITDADLAAVAPWASAAQMNSAIGAVESVRSSVAANRGYLEAIRP